MSVLDIDKVDGIGISNDGTELALLITDHIDWTNEYAHLVQLQNKVNSYVSFIENKQYEEIYPEHQFTTFRIEIHFQNKLNQNCVKFIDTVNKQLYENRIVVEYIIT